MGMTASYDLGAVTRAFEIPGQFVTAAPYGSGHINDSFCVECDENGCRMRYIVQRINHRIFTNPIGLMENIERVTAHLADKVAGQPDRHRRVLSLVPARTDLAWHVDADGNTWRAYHFIAGARSYDVVASPEQAFQAARAFGQFQSLLADLPAPPLHETIPGFHHTPTRFAQLEQAVSSDAAGRAASVRREIDFALAHRSITSVLIEAGLPARVTHNDTKLNNVLLDDSTGEGVCVIDLDTVMPGLALYDFGDLVRTTVSPAAEDERDLSRVALQMPMFEGLARGYLSSAGGFLTPAEKQLLAFSGRLITFEIGLRFLADHLNGDTYFKIHREGHNLDRARTQFRLVELLEQKQHSMEKLVESLG